MYKLLIPGNKLNFSFTSLELVIEIETAPCGLLAVIIPDTELNGFRLRL